MTKPTPEQIKRRAYTQKQTVGRINVTTATGKVVHAPTTMRFGDGHMVYTGVALCRYLTGIMYTDERVNCRTCLKMAEATKNE